MKIALFLLLAALLFTGCSVPCEPVLPAGADPTPVLRREIVLRLSFNTLYIRPGDTQQLTAAVYERRAPAEGCRVAFSTASGAATVDEDGRITAGEAGESRLLAAVLDETGRVLAEEGVQVICSDSAPWYGGFTYIGGVLLVNKEFSLPESYDPDDLLPEVRQAMEQMFEAARQEGLKLWNQSSYRSYGYQEKLYKKYVREWGSERAERFSARPGHSEHQTGLTFDLNTITEEFGDTPEGRWVAEHAPEYGFIVRYAKAFESVTGYRYEPWHLRYLGPELAQKVSASGLSLEEFLGVPTVFIYEFE